MASVIPPDAPAGFQTNPTRRKARGNAADDGDDPATSTRVGSISHDRVKKGFNLEWEDLDDFNAWCKAEQLDNSIEFISHHTTRSAGPIWRERRVYSCARGRTKGKDPYQPKSGTNRKIEKKFTDCKCKITLKLYWHVPTVLGRYDTEHNHPIHQDNLRFMCLSGETRALVLDLLRLRVNTKQIVRHHYVVQFRLLMTRQMISGSACNHNIPPIIAIITLHHAISAGSN
jgi:hypothetical protein